MAQAGVDADKLDAALAAAAEIFARLASAG
jgi:hypothetical protein